MFSSLRRKSSTVSKPTDTEKKESPKDLKVDTKEETVLEKKAETTTSESSEPKKEKSEVKSEKKAKKPGKITVDNRFFKVRRIDVRDPESGKIVHTVGEVVLKENTLSYTVQGYGIPISYDDGIFQRKPKCRIEYLLMHLEVMKKNENPPTAFQKLVEYLEEEYARFKVKADKMIAENRITFDALWYLFKKGQKCFGRLIDNQVVGGEILKIRYFNAGMTEAFEVEAKTIKSSGQDYFTYKKHFRVPAYDGFKELTSLVVQPMNDKMMKILMERGKIFEKVALEHHYMQYNGYLMYERAYGVNMFKADGRVMVDIKTFQRINPAYLTFKDANKMNGNNGNFDDDWAQAQAVLYREQNPTAVELLSEKIPEDLLYQTWPTVAGFSFACKKWGEILVTHLEPIKFDDKAYDRLVLPGEKKSLIKALVDQHQKHRKIVTDIISGKGGGRIFLLHGPPGVGKTLTAEAIAERLQDPLYSVTVGELGTSTKDLEAKLQEILEVASIWNAVILIDEADIFLEARSDNDIIRNAMVGIFLRLLEYHQGVLFLTTNRVKCFDEAFNSRISVALKYEQLDEAARSKVWHNFLVLTEVEGDVQSLANKLAKFELNGRQIRTAIQLSQALAQSEGVPISLELVSNTLSISSQFDTDLGFEKLKGEIEK